MGIHVIIPARQGSSRLPGKVLMDMNGLPLIQHTYERAKQFPVDSVTIATDDKTIANTCQAFGATVVETSMIHQNGTERAAEAAKQLGFNDDDIIINCQVDEPLVSPAAIKIMIDEFQAGETFLQTLAAPIRKMTDVFDPNIIKVVLNSKQEVMLFSRAPMPWDKGGMKRAKELLSELYLGHIGVYAYRAKDIWQYANWDSPLLEQIEQLEQLRVLWHGQKVKASLINDLPISINTEEDVIAFCEHLNQQSVESIGD